MNILCIGDVCGSLGCNALLKNLSKIKHKYNIDLVIANGENSSDGNGISPYSAKMLLDIGVDIITGGNHTFKRKDIVEHLEETDRILRPANYSLQTFGTGVCYLDMGYTYVCIINLMGVAFMESTTSPFEAADVIIEQAKKRGIKIILVDFHAEATSEKRALGFYLDGKISALFGTHTHVQTSDEQILPNGTGYITDLGMTGPKNSVLGVNPDIAIAKLKDKAVVRFEPASGEVSICGCIFDVDTKTGKTISVNRIEII